MNFWRKIWASNKFRAFFLLSLAALFSISLISYSPVDASFDLATGRNIYSNLLGKAGAYTADLSYQLIGLAAYILPLCLISWSYIIYKRGG